MQFLFLIALAAAAKRQSASPPLPAEPIQPPEPVRFEITHVEASQPQFIRIFNLYKGTREIVLPPANLLQAEKTHIEANHPQPIRILNLGEGTREIALPPAP